MSDKSRSQAIMCMLCLKVCGLDSMREESLPLFAVFVPALPLHLGVATLASTHVHNLNNCHRSRTKAVPCLTDFQALILVVSCCSPVCCGELQVECTTCLWSLLASSTRLRLPGVSPALQSPWAPHTFRYGQQEQQFAMQVSIWRSTNFSPGTTPECQTLW